MENFKTFIKTRTISQLVALAFLITLIGCLIYVGEYITVASTIFGAIIGFFWDDIYSYIKRLMGI